VKLSRELQQGLTAVKEQLSEIPALKAQVADLQLVTARRFDTHQEVTKLKEQLKKLTLTFAKKIEVAEAERLAHLNTELQTLHNMVSTKADRGTLDTLESGVIQELREHKTAHEKLEARLEILAGGQASRNEDIVHLTKDLHQMQERFDSRIQDIQSRLGTLTGKLTAQDPSTVLDQLNAQYRAMSTALSQKVDWAEVEQVKGQVNSLSTSIANKVEARISSQLLTQFRTMCAATSVLTKSEVSTAVTFPDSGGIPPFEKPFVACIDRLTVLSDDMKGVLQTVDTKADKVRVEQLIEQFQVLADLLTPRLNSKPKPRTPQRPLSARAAGHRPLGAAATASNLSRTLLSTENF
jgi:hypothetical protein